MLNSSDEESPQNSTFSTHRNSRSKPDGDDAKSLYEEESILDKITSKSKRQTWSPYRIDFDEINEEMDNQWEEDF